MRQNANFSPNIYYKRLVAIADIFCELDKSPEKFKAIKSLTVCLFSRAVLLTRQIVFNSLKQIIRTS